MVCSSLCVFLFLHPVGRVTKPLFDPTWNRMCSQCGGINHSLKLDPANAQICTCHMDGIAFADSCHWDLEDLPAESSALYDAGLNLPKRIHIDKNKLVASVYAKSHSGAGGDGNMNTLNKSNKFVLKYTDAGIQKPRSSTKVASPTGFPKLVSRYTGKKTSKDGLSVCTESYRPHQKVTIVTHSFS